MAIESIVADQVQEVAPKTARASVERALRFRIEVENAPLATPVERGQSHPVALLDLNSLRQSMARDGIGFEPE